MVDFPFDIKNSEHIKNTWIESKKSKNLTKLSILVQCPIRRILLLHIDIGNVNIRKNNTKISSRYSHVVGAWFSELFLMKLLHCTGIFHSPIRYSETFQNVYKKSYSKTFWESQTHIDKSIVLYNYLFYILIWNIRKHIHTNS